MNRKSFYPSSVVLLTLLMVFGGCGKTEETPATPAATPASEPAPAPGVSARTIEVGKAIGADKKITTPANTFAKGDTIYASVETTGSGTATLKAKWTYNKAGQSTVVNEESRTIMATGPEVTEFHVQKPDGWPAGDYQVEVFLDDKSVGVENFKVS